MSRETIEWLNNNVLIGYADRREQWTSAGGWVKDADNGLIVPWHATPDYDGAFAGPIPVEAVNERLFHWTAESRPIKVFYEEHQNGDRYQPADEWQAVTRSDTGTVLGVFKNSYAAHQYGEWLLTNVANIIDDELGIESAGLLQGGAVAWVSVSLPEPVRGEAGFSLLPKLLAFTSMNGAFATSYKRTPFSPDCDNSLTVVRSGDGAEWKVRHSRQSLGRIGDAREALGILYRAADEDVEFFDLLAKWEVSNDEFRQVLDVVVPEEQPKVEAGKVTNQRAVTTSVDKRHAIVRCYKHDGRANVWDGTALGTVQAFNTWDQHLRDGVRQHRVERQMLNTLGRQVADFDGKVLATVSDVTGWHIARPEITTGSFGPLALVRN